MKLLLGSIPGETGDGGGKGSQPRADRGGISLALGFVISTMLYRGVAETPQDTDQKHELQPAGDDRDREQRLTSLEGDH